MLLPSFDFVPTLIALLSGVALTVFLRMAAAHARRRAKFRTEGILSTVIAISSDSTSNDSTSNDSVSKTEPGAVPKTEPRTETRTEEKR